MRALFSLGGWFNRRLRIARWGWVVAPGFVTQGRRAGIILRVARWSITAFLTTRIGGTFRARIDDMQFRRGEDAVFYRGEQDIATDLSRRDIGLGRGGQGIKRVNIGFRPRALGMRRRVSATVVDAVTAEDSNALNIARQRGG